MVDRTEMWMGFALAIAFEAVMMATVNRELFGVMLVFSFIGAFAIIVGDGLEGLKNWIMK